MASKSKGQKLAKEEKGRAQCIRDRTKREEYRAKYLRKRVSGVSRQEKEKDAR